MGGDGMKCDDIGSNGRGLGVVVRGLPPLPPPLS